MKKHKEGRWTFPRFWARFSYRTDCQGTKSFEQWFSEFCMYHLEGCLKLKTAGLYYQFLIQSAWEFASLNSFPGDADPKSLDKSWDHQWIPRTTVREPENHCVREPQPLTLMLTMGT